MKVGATVHYIGSIRDHHGLAEVRHTYTGRNRYRLATLGRARLDAVRGRSITIHTGADCLECALLSREDIDAYLAAKTERAIARDNKLTPSEERHLLAVMVHRNPVPGSTYYLP